MSVDKIAKAWAKKEQEKDAERKCLLVGASAPGALYQPFDRVTWISACGFGPYTSRVLGSEIQSVGVAYWCETAIESENIPTHLAARYWVYPDEIERAARKE